jgi:transcriptional regulator with XRE-family HTH domain
VSFVGNTIITNNVDINVGQHNNGNKDTDKLLNIRQLIKGVCHSRNITAKKLCYGVCTESYFSEFINKGKYISKLMLDLFLQRLGINECDFENYLLKKEYKTFNMCHEIIFLIEKKDINNAKLRIEEFRDATKNIDKLHERFVLLMEARIMQLNNEDSEKTYFKLKDAVEITVQNFENMSLDGLLIGYNELFFMIECLSYKEKAYNCKSVQMKYNEILNYIQDSNIDNNGIKLDSIIKARLYSKLACLLAQKQISNNKYIALLGNCNKSILHLQKSTKLFFVEEIIENKAIALNNIINTYENKERKTDDDIRRRSSYIYMKERNEKEKELFSMLFKKYNLSEEPYHWYPLNHSREIYSVGEIIKIRRKMFGMSIEDLAVKANISMKTLERIESNGINPYSYTIKNIFMALGILGESQAYVFDCSSYEAYELEKKLSHLIDSDKYEEAYEILEEFKRNIDLSNKLNKQYLGHKETVVLSKIKKINNDDILMRFISSLELTLSKDNIFSDTKKYFTKREIMLIYNIALAYKKKGKNEDAFKWLAWCENYYENFNLDISTYIITYELVMTLYASLQGDVGNYDKSDEIAENIMSESLKCRRGRFIGRLIYNEAFNFKKKFEANKRDMQPHEIYLYKDKIEQALVISRFMDDKLLENFLKNKLVEI